MAATRRRLVAGFALALPLWLAGCATPAGTPPDAAVRAVLAPTGTLRVGVYPGSPTSLVRDPRTGAVAGVAHDLGQALGRALGVPVRLVEVQRVAQVIDGLKAGEIDVTFTNASPQRAREVDFTAPLLRLELGFLVPPESSIERIDEIDRPGRVVGVTQGSTSQATLPAVVRGPRIVPLASLAQAREALLAHRVDAFATNKGVLHDLADQLPGAKVLPGRWGTEQLAIAIPQGRGAAMPWLQRFADQLQASGQLQAMATRAALRGLSDQSADRNFRGEP